MKLAKRMDRLGTENAFVVLAEVNKLISKGKDIISFCIGEPDFDTPDNIKKAAIKAIEDGYTHYGAARKCYAESLVERLRSCLRGTRI